MVCLGCLQEMSKLLIVTIASCNVCSANSNRPAPCQILRPLGQSSCRQSGLRGCFAHDLLSQKLRSSALKHTFGIS